MASGEGADSSQSGQVVTDLSDSGSDIDISALVEHSYQHLSSSPVISGHGVQAARQGQASQASGSNAFTEQQHINSQILYQLSVSGARIQSMENSVKNTVKKTKIKKSKSKARVNGVQVGSQEVFVNHKVRWPHEFMPSGQNKDRVTYNQLSPVQWMAGFC